METIANSYLRGGDVASAANLYTSMEHLNSKYTRMARICRVLADPTSVPLPHRHSDMCEAMCSAMVPPEFLMGQDPTAEGIQKKFQRLAVYVHPDKNPHPQAGESFQRLAAMRDEALRLLEQRKSKAAEEQWSAAASMDAVGRKAKGGSRKSKKAAAGSKQQQQQHSQQQSPVEAVIIPNLNALKQTRITLKSLKRKEIDDNFEIFSSTYRPPAEQSGIEHDPADDGANVNLAATAPSRLVIPREVRPPPKKVEGTKGRPLVARKPQPSASDSNAVGASPRGTSASATAPASPVGSTAPPSVALSVGDLSNSVVPASMGDDDKRVIRDQIESVIAGLAAIKTQRTGIRLTCDLSFDTYQHHKRNDNV